MDQIRFELVEARAPGASDPGMRYAINGRSLLALVQEVERPYAEGEGHPDLAGDYAPLPLHWIRESPAYFLGGDVGQDRWPGSPGSVLFACGGCGEVGCWPLLVTIEISANVVRWTDFRQPYRAPGLTARQAAGQVWEYDALGPFAFDRSRYEAELSRLDADIRNRSPHRVTSAHPDRQDGSDPRPRQSAER